MATEKRRLPQGHRDTEWGNFERERNRGKRKDKAEARRCQRNAETIEAVLGAEKLRLGSSGV
jgi:hypothetical protein